MKHPTLRLTAISCAIVGLIGFVGTTRPLFADPPAAASTPSIDPAAMDLLKKVQTTMFALQTYSARCNTTLTYPKSDTRPALERRETATLLAVKPNKMRYEQQYLIQDKTTGQWQLSAKPGMTFVSDGKTFWQQYGASYHKSNTPDTKDLHAGIVPWSDFYSVEASLYSSEMFEQKNNRLIELRKDGTETVDGVSCDKVFAHEKMDYEGKFLENWTTYYIAPDGLLRRKVSRTELDSKPSFTSDSVIKDIKANTPAPTDPQVFAYSPPKGVTQEEPRVEQKLLANGTSAPDFTAVDKEGKPASLAAYKGKVVIVDFWASWCPPCRASMPHNQEIAKKLKAEGLPVVLLAVDNSEEKDGFDKWVKDNSQFDALTFVYTNPKESDVAGKKYQVTGIPTQYVIDAKGVIRASFVGYGGPTDDLEKAVREALKQ